MAIDIVVYFTSGDVVIDSISYTIKRMTMCVVTISTVKKYRLVYDYGKPYISIRHALI